MRWSYEAKSCKEELTGCFETLSGDGDPSFGVNRAVQEGPAWPPAWFQDCSRRKGMEASHLSVSLGDLLLVPYWTRCGWGRRAPGGWVSEEHNLRLLSSCLPSHLTVLLLP